VIKDDFVPIVEAIIETDVIVFDTPLYFFSYLKATLDHFFHCTKAISSAKRSEEAIHATHLLSG